MCQVVPPNGLQQWPKNDPKCFTGQARPTDLRIVPCLGQANLCVSCAGPSGPPRNYRTTPWLKESPPPARLCLMPCSSQLTDNLVSLNFLIGRPRDAHPLFFKMPRTSMHSYNAMLTGYTCLALAAPAAEIFAAMLHRDLISYNAAMPAFAWSGENGEQ
jgi:hypothetical protein